MADSPGDPEASKAKSSIGREDPCFVTAISLAVRFFSKIEDIGRRLSYVSPANPCTGPFYDYTTVGRSFWKHEACQSAHATVANSRLRWYTRVPITSEESLRYSLDQPLLLHREHTTCLLVLDGSRSTSGSWWFFSSSFPFLFFI